MLVPARNGLLPHRDALWVTLQVAKVNPSSRRALSTTLSYAVYVERYMPQVGILTGSEPSNPNDLGY